MPRLLFTTLLALPLFGCNIDSASSPPTGSPMLGVESGPVGGPADDPFRPSRPVQLSIPAEPALPQPKRPAP